MHYGEMTPEAIEQAALSGTLTVFELEDIILIEHPSLAITEKTWRAAYKNEISSRIEQAIGDIDYASKNNIHSGFYKETMLYLKDAEQRIKEAQKRGYETNFSEFEEGIKKVLDGTKKDFEGSKALLFFVESSEFDLKNHKMELQNRLPELGNQYAIKKLKESRRATKYLKRSFKTGKDCFGRLENSLEVLEGLKEYGITDFDIQQIKSTAYKNGVERLLNIAKDSAISNRKKSERIIKTAARNAERLGRDISSETGEIRQLYSND
ncbi:hypothetical protein D4Q76_01460 [archaeon]|nr:MAG: hypothetical protein D4Q76_01460 [archaeon]